MKIIMQLYGQWQGYLKSWIVCTLMTSTVGSKSAIVFFDEEWLDLICIKVDTAEQQRNTPMSLKQASKVGPSVIMERKI